MATKQSSSKLSTLASRVLSGDKKPTNSDAKKLAASVLSQDEKNLVTLCLEVCDRSHAGDGI